VLVLVLVRGPLKRSSTRLRPHVSSRCSPPSVLPLCMPDSKALPFSNPACQPCRPL
jgi:hypothetical protein